MQKKINAIFEQIQHTHTHTHLGKDTCWKRMVLDDFIRRDFWLERLIRDAEMIAAVVVQACQWVEGSVSEEREKAQEKSSLTLCQTDMYLCSLTPTNQQRKEK